MCSRSSDAYTDQPNAQPISSAVSGSVTCDRVGGAVGSLVWACANSAASRSCCDCNQEISLVSALRTSTNWRPLHFERSTLDNARNSSGPGGICAKPSGNGVYTASACSPVLVTPATLAHMFVEHKNETRF